MSDDQGRRSGDIKGGGGWVAPDSTPAPTSGAASSGPVAQLDGASPSGGGTAWTQQPGWSPPPKPGLVPLRPLGFGTILAAPFQTLRRNPKATFGSGLLVQLITVLLTAAVFIPVVLMSVGRLEAASPDDVETIAAGSVAIILLVSLIPLAVSVAATALLQGVMVIEVSRATLGEKLTLGTLWRRAARRLGPLIAWVLLLSLAGLAMVVTVVVFVVGISLALGPMGIVIGAIIGFLIGLGFIALAVWLFTKLSLVPSVIVLEHAGLGRAMRRSWSLTDGYFWRTFGIEALVAVIVNIAAQVITQPLGFVLAILAVLVDPTGSGAGLPILAVGYVVLVAVSIVTAAIASVVQAALIAVIYIDLRMRKEGLDLELQRYVEGFADRSADPYDVRQRPTAAGQAAAEP